MIAAAADLRSLRGKPFELLRKLERLARTALTGQGRDLAPEREWVGVAFRLSAENFLVAREETREVLGLPAVLTRVPGARPWIRGVANVRGQLLPVVDLRAFLGGGATNTNRSTRVLVANHREVPAGCWWTRCSAFVVSRTRSSRILTADLDLDEIPRSKYDFDIVGHYSRPDIFRLHVNTRPTPPVVVSSGVDDGHPT